MTSDRNFHGTVFRRALVEQARNRSYIHLRLRQGQLQAYSSRKQICGIHTTVHLCTSHPYFHHSLSLRVILFSPRAFHQDVDIVFAYATKYSTERGIYLTELSRKLLDLKSGAKVITVDKRLQGPFNLITTVLDPNGDLQTSTGFLWQRQ